MAGPCLTAAPAPPLIVPASAISGFGEKKAKKHREAKKLVNAAGEEFKIGELVEEKIRMAKGHKILFADLVEELKHHYKQNPHHTKNAISISAMKLPKGGKPSSAKVPTANSAPENGSTRTAPDSTALSLVR